MYESVSFCFLVPSVEFTFNQSIVPSVEITFDQPIELDKGEYAVPISEPEELQGTLAVSSNSTGCGVESPASPLTAFVDESSNPDLRCGFRDDVMVLVSTLLREPIDASCFEDALLAAVRTLGSSGQVRYYAHWIVRVMVRTRRRAERRLNCIKRSQDVGLAITCRDHELDRHDRPEAKKVDFFERIQAENVSFSLRPQTKPWGTRNVRKLEVAFYVVIHGAIWPNNYHHGAPHVQSKELEVCTQIC